MVWFVSGQAGPAEPHILRPAGIGGVEEVRERLQPPAPARAAG